MWHKVIANATFHKQDIKYHGSKIWGFSFLKEEEPKPDNCGSSHFHLWVQISVHSMKKYIMVIYILLSPPTRLSILWGQGNVSFSF